MAASAAQSVASQSVATLPPSPLPAADRRQWWVGLGLFVLVLGSYAPVLRHPLLAWDDQLHITQNPLYRPVSGPHLLAPWLGPWSGTYAPLTYTVWAGEARLAEALTSVPSESPGQPATRLITIDESFRRQAWLFHAGNLLLHLAGVFVAWRVLGRLVAIPGAAAWGAAWWAVHPLQVECVAWASETKGLLATLAGGGALWAYLRAAQTTSPRARWCWLLVATGAYLAALGSKPSAVGLPLAILALVAAGWRIRWRQLALLLVVWGACGLAIAEITRQAQPSASAAAQPSAGERVLIAADALAFSAGKLVWPWPLAPDYGRQPAGVIERGWWWGAVLAIVTPLVVLAVPPLRRTAGPPLLFALAALLPNLGLVPFEFQRFSTVADRYTAGALWGLAWLVARCLAGLPRPGRVAVGTILVGVCCVVARRQLPVWSSDQALYAHTVAVNPRSSLAWNGWGNLAAAAGDDARALECYDRLLEFDANAAAYFNRAQILARRGELAPAIESLERALAVDPGYAKARRRLAELQLASGEWVAARGSLELVLLTSPDEPDTRLALARCLVALDRPAEAAEQFRRLATDQGEWTTPANELAWLLATHPDPTVRHGPEAVRWAEQAVAAAPTPTANLLDTLAAAQAAAGDFAAAVSTATRALTLARERGEAELAEKLLGRLEAYRRHQAWSEPRNPAGDSR